MPICSSATNYVYPDKYLSVDKPGVSITIYSIVTFTIQITVCGWLTSSLFVIHQTALLQCVLQRWHVDESWHMAADGCSRVHFLWANPQLPNRCCLRSGSASWWDIQEFIRIRIIEKKSCSLMWHDIVVEKSTDDIVAESSTIIGCSLLVICQEAGMDCSFCHIWPHNLMDARYMLCEADQFIHSWSVHWCGVYKSNWVEYVIYDVV